MLTTLASRQAYTKEQEMFDSKKSRTLPNKHPKSP